MPCYLFTYHGHATWMPDHPRGYVHRQQGLKPSDPHMAQAYRQRQREPRALFTSSVQSVLVATARQTEMHIDVTVHAVATEPTHVHVLVSWQHARPWRSIRTSLRSALTRMLNDHFGKRTWFSDSPSRKRVRDRDHFDHLVIEYLPKHGGVKWFREVDVVRASARKQSAKR